MASPIQSPNAVSASSYGDSPEEGTMASPPPTFQIRVTSEEDNDDNDDSEQPQPVVQTPPRRRARIGVPLRRKRRHRRSKSCPACPVGMSESAVIVGGDGGIGGGSIGSYASVTAGGGVGGGGDGGDNDDDDDDNMGDGGHQRRERGRSRVRPPVAAAQLVVEGLVPMRTQTQPSTPVARHEREVLKEVKVRVGTFNCENLVARYKFSAAPDRYGKDGFTLNDLAFHVSDQTKREITAQAIRTCDCDILALQEVEEGKVLDRFNQEFLKGMGYEYSLVISAHDPRFIDIGVLSRYPLLSIRSHKDERDPLMPDRYLFSRDCLEVDFDVQGVPLTLYVNHFKALNRGRASTRERRLMQANRVAELVSERWKAFRYRGNYAVLGDLNDYPDKESALQSLLEHPGLENVVQRLPPDEQWTHYFGAGNTYQQLDYILLSKSLAKLNPEPPVIMRMGMPFRAKQYEGRRFASVGWDRPKASDHAPVYMDLLLHNFKKHANNPQITHIAPMPQPHHHHNTSDHQQQHHQRRQPQKHHRQQKGSDGGGGGSSGSGNSSNSGGGGKGKQHSNHHKPSPQPSLRKSPQPSPRKKDGGDKH